MEVVPTGPEVATEQTATGGTGSQSGGAEHFDVVVVGGGPGGYAAALYGAAAGLSIGIGIGSIKKSSAHVPCLFSTTRRIIHDGHEGTRSGSALGPLSSVMRRSR